MENAVPRARFSKVLEQALSGSCRLPLSFARQHRAALGAAYNWKELITKPISNRAQTGRSGSRRGRTLKPAQIPRANPQPLAKTSPSSRAPLPRSHPTLPQTKNPWWVQESDSSAFAAGANRWVSSIVDSVRNPRPHQAVMVQPAIAHTAAAISLSTGSGQC